MKRFIFLPILFVFSLLFSGLIVALLIFYFRPEWVINKNSVEFLLNRTTVFQEWSWKKVDINIDWVKWNDRRLYGQIEDFCFTYQKETLSLKTCLKEVSWDFNLKWSLKEGFHARALTPVYLLSPFTELKTRTSEKTGSKKPPEVWKLWTRLWSDIIPPFNFDFEKIRYITDGKEREFDLHIVKEMTRLQIEALGGKLVASPKQIEIFGPPDIVIPSRFKTKNKLLLNNVKLTAVMKENGIPLILEGYMDEIDIQAESFIRLPLQHGLSSLAFRKEMLQNTSGSILIKNIKEFVHTYIPEPYNELPAPLNTMNGTIGVKVKTVELSLQESLLIKTATHIDLKGETQFLDMIINTDVPLNLRHFSRGIINVGVDFSKVVIQLPRLSRKEAPPQFFPDKRFKKRPEPQSQMARASSPPVSFDLEAENEHALHIKSNLIEEPLRLNFNLNVREGEIKSGYLKILPLQTTIFKRPVKLNDFTMTFNAPQSPVVNASILFPLPEYKITMKVEGPITDPKYAFSSKPPLPQNDIYSVLLFGRPVDELSPDDRESARKTNQILTQGVLSLSVLYFLAGSPVEYVGYDPESRRATAQIGLGRRSSLRVGAGQGGGVTGVRRSLGKGWYLDTSVQNTSNPTDKNSRNYGVLLERIIAY